jgi:hypothetical protein
MKVVLYVKASARLSQSHFQFVPARTESPSESLPGGTE